MCRRTHVLIALFWTTSALHGCHDHEHHTHGAQKHPHSHAQGSSVAETPRGTTTDAEPDLDPALLTISESLKVVDGALIPDGNTLVLILKPGETAADNEQGKQGKTVILLLAREGLEEDLKTEDLNGTWIVAGPGLADRRETQAYGASGLKITLQDLDGRAPIESATDQVTRGPNGHNAVLSRTTESGTQLHRQISRIRGGSILLALNRLWRVERSPDWSTSLKRQAFLSIGLRPPPSTAREVEGAWRSINLSGDGSRATWALQGGRYTSSTSGSGDYAQGEEGWLSLTPDGDSSLRYQALLNSSAGFGLLFQAGLNPDGTAQKGNGIYAGSALWWRSSTNGATGGVAGSWRVYGRIVLPPQGTQAQEPWTRKETYGGELTIDAQGTLSGRMGYWGTPPWITMKGKITSGDAPSGDVHLEVPLGLRESQGARSVTAPAQGHSHSH